MLYTGLLAPTVNGTAANPITIRKSSEAGRNGTVVIFGGRSTLLPEANQASYTVSGTGRQFGADLQGRSYITIDGRTRSGIVVYGCGATPIGTAAGINLNNLSDHITLRNIEVFDCGTYGQYNRPSDNALVYKTDRPGIRLGGTYITIDRCLVHDCGQDPIQAGYATSNLVVSNTWLYGRRMHSTWIGYGFNAGSQANPDQNTTHADGIQLYAGGANQGPLTFDHSVAGPLISQGFYAGDATLTSFDNVSFKHCVVLAPFRHGIQGDTYSGTTPANWTIDHCTVHGPLTPFPGYVNTWLGIEVESGTGHSLKDTIVTWGANFYNSSAFTGTNSGNIYNGAGGDPLPGGTNVDPQFVAALGTTEIPSSFSRYLQIDWTPQAASAIGKGSELHSIQRLLDRIDALNTAMAGKASAAATASGSMSVQPATIRDPYNKIVGYYTDTDEHYNLTDATVEPLGKILYASLHWNVAGIAGRIAAIKAANPGIKLLAYQNLGGMIAGPHTNNRPTTLVTQEQAAAHGTGADDWRLHKQSDGTVITFNDFTFLQAANIARASYVTQAAGHFAAIKADGFDGVFLDDVNMTPGHGFNTADPGRSSEFASDNAYRDAVVSAMTNLAAAARAQGLIVVPNVGMDPWNTNHYSGFQSMLTNGSMDVVNREFWTNWNSSAVYFDGATWSDTMKVQTDAEAAGAAVMVNSYPLSTPDHTRSIRYGLASFYLHWDGVKASGFGYNDGRPLANVGNYRSLIGAPTEAKQLVSGTTADGAWMRHFTGGVVIANAKSTAGTVTFTLGGTYVDPNGAQVTSVGLDTKQGMVLLSPGPALSGAAAGASSATGSLTVAHTSGTVALAGVAQASASTRATLEVVGPTRSSWFGDGRTIPKVTVSINVGGSMFRPANAFVLDGTALLNGTFYLTDGQWVDITDDVNSIVIERGRESIFDGARPGICTILLDNESGNYDPENPNGLYAAGGKSQIDAGLPIRVQVEWGGTVYSRFFGEVADVEADLDGYAPAVIMTCADGLEKLGRARLGVSIAQNDPEYSGIRLGRLADAAGWATSLRLIETGKTLLGKMATNDFTLPLMQKIERTEGGFVFVDGDGRLVFFDRHHAATDPRSVTAQAVFGDDIEIQSLRASRSRGDLINDWHIIRDAMVDEDTPVEQVATDYTSISAEQNGTLSGPTGFGELCRNDEDALGMAQGLLERTKVLETKIREIVVEAIALNAWDVLLPIRLLDRIAVIRDYGPNTYSLERLVQKTREEIVTDENEPVWNLTFTTSSAPAAPKLFKLDGTQKLNGTGILGW